MARRIVVEILADTRNVEKGFDRTAKSAQRFQTSITGVGRAFKGAAIATGAALGTREVAQGLQAATMAASDLSEQMNRSRVLFGESSASVEAWSKTTAESFGIAQREALAAAGNFGSMFSTIGLGVGKAAAMSRALVELAADMASFNNTDPSEMLDRLRSGLAGEAEPLRRFGVFISEARVAQEAWTTGIAKTGAKLTEQQKVLARYSLILKDTAKQQGDFARTSDSLANQMRVLNAEWDEAQATLGKALVPVVSWLIEGFNEWTRDVGILAREFDRALSSMAARFVGWASNIASVASHLPSWLGGGWAKDMQKNLDEMKRGIEHHARSVGQDIGVQVGLGFQAALKEHLAIKNFEPSDVTGGGAVAGFRATVEQRNTWWDAMIGRKLDRVQDVRTLGGQITALRKIAALVRERLRLTKDITRRQTLEDLLLGVQRQIQGTQEASAARTKALADERRQLEKERREREALARQTRLFRDLGFGPGGADLVPGVRALRDRFQRVARDLAGTPLANKFKEQMKGIRKVLNDEFTKTDQALRNKIEEMLANIDRKMKDSQRKRRDFRIFNTTAMLQGLGLTPEQMRVASSRLAAVGRTGTVPMGGTGSAFGARIPTNVNVTLQVDGDKLGTASIKGIQREARRRATQTRGPNAGSAMAFVR